MGKRKDLLAGVVVSALGFSVRAADCNQSGDANDSGSVDVSDAVYVLDFLFLGGPPPPLPFPGCGVDPTVDELTCEMAPPCP